MGEIVLLVADGLSNRQISERLFVSERTVETHVSHVLGKLGGTSRTDIVAWALTSRSGVVGGTQEKRVVSRGTSDSSASTSTFSS